MAQCQALVYADPTFKAHSHVKPHLCRTPGGIKKAPSGAVLGVYCRHHFEALYPHVGRCAGCRWWDANGRPDLMLDGMCERMGYADTQTRRDPNGREAFVRCGCAGPEACGCPAFLYTAADFGCVQWEAKPDIS